MVRFVVLPAGASIQSKLPRVRLAILDGVSVALGEAETSDRNAVVMRNAIPIPKRKPQKVVLSEITPQNHIRNYPSKSIVRAHSRPEW